MFNFLFPIHRPHCLYKDPPDKKHIKFAMGHLHWKIRIVTFEDSVVLIVWCTLYPVIRGHDIMRSHAALILLIFWTRNRKLNCCGLNNRLMHNWALGSAVIDGVRER